MLRLLFDDDKGGSDVVVTAVGLYQGAAVTAAAIAMGTLQTKHPVRATLVLGSGGTVARWAAAAAAARGSAAAAPAAVDPPQAAARPGPAASPAAAARGEAARRAPPARVAPAARREVAESPVRLDAAAPAVAAPAVAVAAAAPRERAARRARQAAAAVPAAPERPDAAEPAAPAAPERLAGAEPAAPAARHAAWLSPPPLQAVAAEIPLSVLGNMTECGYPVMAGGAVMYAAINGSRFALIRDLEFAQSAACGRCIEVTATRCPRDHRHRGRLLQCDSRGTVRAPTAA